MPRESELDFEILREPWNKYSLKDGTNVKCRYILTKVKKREPENEKEKPTYGIEGQNVSVIYNVSADLKGPPSTVTYSPPELASSIKEDDVGYDTLSEEWNEYIVEDGTKIRLKGTVVKVSRTDKTDRNGDPIYIVQTTLMVGIQPRKV